MIICQRVFFFFFFPSVCVAQDMLVTVFENGTILKEYTLDEIRKNAQLWEEDLSPGQHNQDHSSTLDIHQEHIMNGMH